MKTSKLLTSHKCIARVLLLIGALSNDSPAAPGDVDLSFDPGSVVNGAVNAIVLQPDGKVIIRGSFSSVQGLMRSRIARLNADGSADSSFDQWIGIEIDNPLASPGISSVALQSDGKVLTGGFFTHVNGTNRTSIARLHANGSLDAGFNARLSADIDPYPHVLSLAVQADGKVLVGGKFNAVNGTNRNGMARLHADGSLDAGFSPELPNGLFAVVTSLAVRADGKILVAGFYPQGTEEGYYEDYFLVRLNADGSRDTGFSSETDFANDPFFPMVTSVAVQADGKVLLGGGFTTVNGTNRNGIARFNADGTLDGSFNPGSTIYTTVHSVIPLADGKVLIGGSFTQTNGATRNRIARLNADGSPDTSFNPGAGANSVVYSVALQPDGKVLLGGDFITVNGAVRPKVARLNPNGSLDASFNPGAGVDNAVVSLAVQPDRKVLIAGQFTTVQEFTRPGIARLHADGSADSTFDAGVTGGPQFNFGNPVINSVVLQSDGKVLIGGNFTNIHGTSRNGIARLHADGSLDGSFNPGTGIAGGVYPVVIFVAALPDGKVFVWGGFTTVNGTNRNGMARFHANGSLDLSFNPDLGSSNVLSVALQSDGKVLVAGSSKGFYNPDPENEGGYEVHSYLLFRLDASGSRDTGFEVAAGDVGPLSTWVGAVAVQPDGKILVGGHFPTFKGINHSGIARLNANGSLDSSFNPGTGTAGSHDPVVTRFAVQPDGRILINGGFSTYNGTVRNGMARLHANGSLDGSFDPGSGIGGVSSLALQSDGKVFLGGHFTTVNGVVRPYVARLHGDSEIPPPGSFADWAAGFGLSGAAAAANADPDGDGMPNGVEYILGGNPGVAAATPPDPAVSATNGNLRFIFPRDDKSETPDVTLTVESGIDLATWPAVFNIDPNTAASSPGVSIDENGAAPDLITVTIPQGTVPRMFARLKVTIAP